MDKAQLLNSTSTSHGRDARVTGTARAGLLFGLLAYTWWGLHAVYFKLLQQIPPLTVLAYRILWSVVLMAIVLSVTRKWRELPAAVRSRGTVLLLLGSTLMISLNWFTFIWAVAHARVVEASLGYYINPLVAVLLGALVLRERLRRWQIAAFVLAGMAVAVLVVRQGTLPWVPLSLALTFGIYGLFRKLSRVGVIAGLMLETSLLAPIAPFFMGWQKLDGSPLDGSSHALLALSGIVTAVPLMAFAASAKRLRLATLGILQYVAPTLQFLLAVIVFREPFHGVQIVAFALIWLAVLIYAIDTARSAAQAPEPAPPE